MQLLNSCFFKRRYGLRVLLEHIADRLILRPTTGPVETEGRSRQTIDTPVGVIEAWLSYSQSLEQVPRLSEVQRVAIKFPGTAGRAERGGPHPFELFPEILTEIWTVNHAGYGGSAGPASLAKFAPVCDAVWHAVQQRYPHLPVVAVGNSLGCVSALYLSARHNLAGIFLRNPVALQAMIRTRPRYNWWNFGSAKWIADRIPQELDAIENARRSQCPALLLRSENDRVAPARYQRMILDAYAGPKWEFVLPGAGHHDRVSEDQVEPYLKFLRVHEVHWRATRETDRS